MKFCEKLQKLRKEKGYSQEELADLLEVSRQSVSKWESGTTYPEMDKLLSLCKIFNVSLDDLTNDEITTSKINEKRKNNFSNLVDSILDMINKTITMFKKMTKKDVAKCLFEMFIVFIILLIFRIPFEILNESVVDIFKNFDFNIYQLLSSIWYLLSNVIYLVLFITIFLYIYKVRFLDNIKVLPEKEVIELNQKEVTKENSEKITIIKASGTNALFECLGSLFNIMFKIFLFFILIPVILCFIMFVILTVIAIFINITGIHYIGFIIALIGCTLVNFVVMELILRALFSSTYSFKRLFATFTSGLIIGCIGAALIGIEISNTKYINSIPENIKINTITNEYNMTDDLIINNYYNYYFHDINYVIDEQRENIEVSVDYYSDYLTVEINNHDLKHITINTYSDFENGMNCWNLIKKHLKEKEFYNYNKLTDIKVTITASSANINKLKENIKKEYEEEKRYESIFDNYENRFEDYENLIEQKDDKIDELNEEIENLNEKIYELEEKIQNIKSEL